MPKLAFWDTSNMMLDHVHGRENKDMIVLHETVSKDIPGWKDIEDTAKYLEAKDYGVHGIVDAEGRIAWAYGCGNAVFWHAGGVNERSVGIETVSNVMLRAPKNRIRKAIWLARKKELRATAKLIACVARAQGIPIRYSYALTPGVTSHWDVSKHFPASKGHTDCWPVHKGGYYPILAVINMAKVYYRLGWRF